MITTVVIDPSAPVGDRGQRRAAEAVIAVDKWHLPPDRRGLARNVPQPSISIGLMFCSTALATNRRQHSEGAPNLRLKSGRF